MQDLSFPDRLTIAVPTPFREAVRSAADARGLAVADYARGAVHGRMLMDGARIPRLPNLDRRVASGR